MESTTEGKKKKKREIIIDCSTATASAVRLNSMTASYKSDREAGKKKTERESDRGKKKRDREGTERK